MSQVINCSNIRHEALYDYFEQRQDEGRYDRYNPDMLTVINNLWNRKLGSVVAMSHTGIGSDITNGFVQFICDHPEMMNKLVSTLTEIREATPRAQQPTIELRSKSLPNDVPIEGFHSYVTVMMRTPRFKNHTEANSWWGSLATKLTNPM